MRGGHIARRSLAEQIEDLAPIVGRLISIDPGSRVTGYAVMDVIGEVRVIDAGRITSKSADPTRRMRNISDELDALMAMYASREAGPGRRVLNPETAVVIEVPTPSGSRKTRPGTHGYGLTTYARAVGRIEAIAEFWAFDDRHVLLVDERDWTKHTSKQLRALSVRSAYPRYKPDDDPGLDVADAIGLGMWAAGRLRAARLALSINQQAEMAGKGER